MLLAVSDLGEIALCEGGRGAVSQRDSLSLRHLVTFSDDALVAVEWLGGASAAVAAGSLPYGMEGFVTVGACATVTMRWRLRFAADTTESAPWTAVRARVCSLDAVDCAAVGGGQPGRLVLAASARGLRGGVVVCSCSIVSQSSDGAAHLSIVPIGKLQPSPAASRVTWLSIGTGVGKDASLLLARRSASGTTLQVWRPTHAGAVGAKFSPIAQPGAVQEAGAAAEAAAEGAEEEWECVGQAEAASTLGPVRSVACNAPPGAAGSTVLLRHGGGAISAFDAADAAAAPSPLACYSAEEVEASAKAHSPGASTVSFPL